MVTQSLRRFSRVAGWIVVGAVLATVLGATAAVASHLVTGKEIARNTITGRNVHDRSLTGADIRDRSLSARDFGQSVQGPQGTAGPAGPPGATGPAGRNALTTFSLKVGPVTTLPASGEPVVATATCAPGEMVINGGYLLAETAQALPLIISSVPGATDAGMGWSVLAQSFSSSASSAIQVTITCAKLSGADAATRAASIRATRRTDANVLARVARTAARIAQNQR